MQQPPLPTGPAPEPLPFDQLQALRAQFDAMERTGHALVPFADCYLLLREVMWLLLRKSEADLTIAYHNTICGSGDMQYQQLNQQYERVLEDRYQAHERIKTLERENAAMRESNAKAAEAIRLLAEKAYQAEVQNAAMRPIIEWAARQDPRVDEDMYEKAVCPGCGAIFGILGTFDWDQEVAALVHMPDCPVIAARAIRAIESEATQ